MRKRVAASDQVRHDLPHYQEKGLDFLTQLRLIHRTHLEGNEAFFISESSIEQLAEISGKVSPPVNRLAGILRSPERLPADIYLGDGILRCANFKENVRLISQLVEAAEELFPKEGTNPLVTRENILYYLSSIQSILVFIHPFWEANGRTSEDGMYALWLRRPDLGPLHYVSSNGSRRGPRVDSRETSIRIQSLALLQEIAEDLGISKIQANSIEDYSDLIGVAGSQLGITSIALEEKYDFLFTKRIEKKIANLRQDNFRFHASNITCHLAANLRDAPTTYTFGYTDPPVKRGRLARLGWLLKQAVA
jgi:hypothetical protein